MEARSKTMSRFPKRHRLGMPAEVDEKRRGFKPCRQRLGFGIGCKTDIGFGRKANQDAFWPALDGFTLDKAGCLVAVADGMGGHHGGGVASRFVYEALNDSHHNLLQSLAKFKPREVSRELTDLIFRIDRSLRVKALKTKDMLDMGTTLSCLVLTGTHSIISHVGDSRIYRWRSGHLSCLTQDHTFVQEMINEGEIDPAAAGTHPLRHLLTQAVGTAEPLEHVLTRADRLKAGDRFLLCTDGLHNWMPKEQISDLMAMDGDADLLALSLVDAALINKTRDNVTALVVTVTGSD